MSVLPSPGPSFVPPLELRGRVRGETTTPSIRVGLTQPSITDDGWWLCTLWAEDESGVVPATALAPTAGPPPGAPLREIGPNLAGALAGLLGQADGRQLIRLRMPPAEDEARPWERPMVLWAAVSWDPIRASTMRTEELARELLRAFARSLEAAGSPA
jgi:hypothetical protein